MATQDRIQQVVEALAKKMQADAKPTKVYFFNYDLHENGDYKGLIKQLEEAKALHVLKSAWLLKTTLTANEISAAYKAHFTKDESVLIIEVGRDRQGWLLESDWNWIRGAIGPN
jgi:hypothetical protein